MSEHAADYDVRRGGVQQVHEGTPGRCWEWLKVTRQHIWAVHVSAGPPAWWLPNAGRSAGWLLLAVQIARRPLRVTPPGEHG